MYRWRFCPFYCICSFFIFWSISCFGQSSFTINKNSKTAVIPFQLVNNVIVVKVKVNGVALNFLLDTGVEETLLLDLQNEEEVVLNNVETVNLRGFGLEESIVGLKATGNRLEVGNLTSENHLLYVVLNRDIGFIASLGIQVNGILGSNFFKNNVVKIDYRKRKIKVYEPSYFTRKFKENHFTSIPIVLEGNKPYITVKIQESPSDAEVTSRFLIDSGLSSTLWLFSPNNNVKENTKTNSFEDFLGNGFSGIVRGSYSKINKISLGNLTLNQVIAAYPDSTFYKHLKLVSNRGGSIGGEVLRRFQVIFDYENRIMYLKPNKYHKDAFSYNKSGIHVQRGGDRLIKVPSDNSTSGSKLTINFGSQNVNVDYQFIRKPAYEIAYLRCDSPAERAGVQIGDIILSINNTVTTGLSLDEVANMLKPKNEEVILLEVDRNGRIFNFRFQLKNILD